MSTQKPIITPLGDIETDFNCTIRDFDPKHYEPTFNLRLYRRAETSLYGKKFHGEPVLQQEWKHKFNSKPNVWVDVPHAAEPIDAKDSVNWPTGEAGSTSST
jgi:hypothetical protein